jgi:hypothetical protein
MRPWLMLCLVFGVIGSVWSCLTEINLTEARCETTWSPSFVCHLILKTIILPRQVQDKHIEKMLRNKGVLCCAAWLSAVGTLR